MLVDTGSSINVLDENIYKKRQVKPKLSKTDTNVFTYGSNTNFPLLGKFIGTWIKGQNHNCDEKRCSVGTYKH